MILTKRAWRFSTDLSATLIPLISLISSPGWSVPKIKKQISLFHSCCYGFALLQTWSSCYSNGQDWRSSRFFFHSSAFPSLSRLGFSELALYADRVRWFSTLLREVFFSPLFRVSSLNSSFLIWSIVIGFAISLNCRALLCGWSYQLSWISRDVRKYRRSLLSRHPAKEGGSPEGSLSPQLVVEYSRENWPQFHYEAGETKRPFSLVFFISGYKLWRLCFHKDQNFFHHSQCAQLNIIFI